MNAPSPARQRPHPAGFAALGKVISYSDGKGLDQKLGFVCFVKQNMLS